MNTHDYQLYVHLEKTHWEHQNLENLQPPLFPKGEKPGLLGRMLHHLIGRAFFFPNNIGRPFLPTLNAPLFDLPLVEPAPIQLKNLELAIYLVSDQST